jgi:Malectin domain
VHNKLLGTIGLFLFTALSSAAQTQPPIRIKCEGPNYTDSRGQLWQADYGYSGGALSSLPATIKGTADQALFLTARKNENSGSSLVYSLNIPNGAYHVNLYFAETWRPAMAVGHRVFNVKMQGNPVFTNLDIFAEAGADAALIKGADITVSNSWATIEFDNVVDVAKIFAIEILPGNSGPALSMNFQYPDGTPVAGSLTYTISSSLLSFSGNAPLVNGQVRCALLANPSAMGISMQFTITATLADSAGHSLWTLNMGMNPSQLNLAAVQQSMLTVVVQRM